VGGVWGSGAGDVFAVSTDGEIFHFDGHGWHDMHAGNSTTLWAVWGTGPADVFAAGEHDTILHYDGTSWSQVAYTGSDSTFNWLWGSGPHDVYAAGGDGSLAHYDGATWTKLPTGATGFLYGVWGSGPNDVFVVGEGSVVLHFDGQGWSSLDTGASFDFWGVWGSGPHDVYLFADTNGVLRYDGAHFEPVTINSIHSFNYGTGSSATDVFALEYHGQGLFHSNGVDWTSLKLPSVTTYSLWATRTVGYLGATVGQVVKLDRHCATHELRCSDRWDDDCDGLLNCEDPDCAQAPECQAGGLCQTLTTLACGTVVSGSTLGGSPQLEHYGCVTPPLNGRERAYRFTAPSTGDVTVTLTSATAQLTAVVLGSFSTGGCDPLGRCLAATDSGTSGARHVTFHATAGQPYSVMVDATDGAAGAFELEVSCP
jgi:hypothetical protein